MPTDDRLTNLMFLLSLPSLAVGCAVGGESMTSQGPPVIDPTTGGDDDDDDPTSTGSSSRGDTSGGADDPGTTDDDGPMMTTMDPPADSTTGEYTCMGMPPMVGEIGPICMQYIAHYNDCFYGGMQPLECVAIYEAFCQYDLEYSTMTYGEACGAAVEDWYVCISQVPCEQLMDEMEDCAAELGVIEMACVMM